MLDKSGLLADLKSKAMSLGLYVVDTGTDGLSGSMKSIRARWLLGARSVSYRMSCRLDDAERTVHFREALVETSWGIAPPTFSTEKTVIKGWERSGDRTDRSLGGGGTIDYGQVREALKQVVTAAGWQFHLEGGRAP